MFDIFFAKTMMTGISLVRQVQSLNNEKGKIQIKKIFSC